MKKFALISIVLFLASCGGGSSGDNPDDDQVVITSNQPVEVFQNSFVRLNYPSDWTLDLDDPRVDAGFKAPEISPRGGNPTCALTSGSVPGESLVAAVDNYLNKVLLDDPEPEIKFLKVNGIEMARISGVFKASGQLVESTAQHAFKDDKAYQLLCAEVSDEETNLIMNSMEIL